MKDLTLGIKIKLTTNPKTKSIFFKECNTGDVLSITSRINNGLKYVDIFNYTTGKNTTMLVGNFMRTLQTLHYIVIG